VPVDPVPMGLRFDSVAKDYANYRPGYPDELFNDLESFVGLRDTSVLEIGCGTGQATGPLLDRGCRVLAIEPGSEMAAIARNGLSGNRFDVDVATFDDWQPGDRRFDLVVAATSFHWVDPGIRWPKVTSVLKGEGAIVLLTNRTVGGGTFDELHQRSFDLHQQYGAEAQEEGAPTESDLSEDLQLASSDIGLLWETAEPKGGRSVAGSLFAEPILRRYPWEFDYVASDAVGLLSTYSPYLAVRPDRRRALLAEIEELINSRFGGRVTRRYLTILALTRCR